MSEKNQKKHTVGQEELIAEIFNTAVKAKIPANQEKPGYKFTLEANGCTLTGLTGLLGHGVSITFSYGESEPNFPKEKKFVCDRLPAKKPAQFTANDFNFTGYRGVKELQQANDQLTQALEDFSTQAQVKNTKIRKRTLGVL